MTLRIRLMATCGHLQSAHDEWKKQLDTYSFYPYPNENLYLDDGVVDKGIEVLTYINQALARLEEVEDILNEVSEQIDEYENQASKDTWDNKD